MVVLWSRLGSPLPASFTKPNGQPYLSGTEWEFEDACTARRDVLVYRRTEKVLLDDEAPDFEQRREQKRRVREFFTRFVNSDNSFNASFTDYATPGEFKPLLGRDLRNLIEPRLSGPAPPIGAESTLSEPPWQGSPYPGLRAFAEAETAIFLGRSRETDELLARLRDPACRFLAIVGDSGAGKSSLVHAGLLPRLRSGALPGSEHWLFASFTPARQMGDPFLSLATALRDALPPAMRPAPRARTRELENDPELLQRSIDKLLSGAPENAELVLVIDQFEELFALGRYESFIEHLGRAAATPRVRVLATMRGPTSSRRRCAMTRWRASCASAASPSAHRRLSP